MARLTITGMSVWLDTQLALPAKHFAIFRARQGDLPNRSVTVMRVGAGRDVHDGDFEEVPFRFQTRGAPENLQDAEDLALTIDEIMFNMKNVMVGLVYVTDCRTVNKPKLVPITDKQSRYQFSADYLVTASRYN